jgi:hypothetical protein
MEWESRLSQRQDVHIYEQNSRDIFRDDCWTNLTCLIMTAESRERRKSRESRKARMGRADAVMMLYPKPAGPSPPASPWPQGQGNPWGLHMGGRQKKEGKKKANVS